MMVLIFVGVSIGLWLHQSSLGFVGGLGVALVYALVTWLIGMNKR